MAVRWDPILIRRLAQELDALLSGAHLRALRLDGGTRDLVLLFRERTLLWRLHPGRGQVLVYPPREPSGEALKLAARVKAVRAPEDERILHVELLPTRGERHTVDLRVELLGNQWNAIVTEGPDARIRHVLVRRSGRRPASVGGVYEAPPPVSREGRGGELTLERWLDLLQPASPETRMRSLVGSVAFTSPLNAPTLLGEAARSSGAQARRALEEGWAAWKRMVDPAEPSRPGVLETARGPQPYPFPLQGGVFHATDTLLDAFAEGARGNDERADDSDPLALLPAGLMAEVEAAVDSALRRATSLEAELAGLEDPDELRALGNLLLAHYGEVPPGAQQVVLPGFEGEPVTVPLDPALEPHENASRLYDRASRVERAQRRLPALVGRARRAATRLEDILNKARQGRATEAEVRALVPARTQERGRPSRDAEPLPYRSWTSSGGLEIRVGRSAKQNDELTFHHSAPGDVWLHARHAAGAHVVLRWSRPGNPPHRDLTEAAVLAALHSEARTSGSVPVDWTLRKYVRKPRGSPPGRVVLERARTLFVSPDPDLPDRLNVET
jgi:predicted ribosome quality control (RQC) complex YloA/Tae2 family protein